MKQVIFFLALIMGFAMLLHTTQALDADGLELYMAFDEGSGKEAKDLSGNGNDGELMGDAQWTADGQFGGGLSLQAIPDFVEVPDSDSLDLEESLTLAIWAKIDGLPDGSCALFMKPTTYMLHTTTGGDGIKMDPLIFIGGSYGSWPTPANATATMGEWHHFAATYDGTEYGLYIDGELIDSYERADGGAIDQDDNVLAIGRDNRPDCSQRNSPCIIDEATIWSRALSEAEVKELMQGNFLAVEPVGKLATCWSSVKTR